MQFCCVIFVVVVDVVVGQYVCFGLCWVDVWIIRCQFFYCMFGQFMVGCEFIVKYGKQWCFVVFIMNIKGIIVSDCLW